MRLRNERITLGLKRKTLKPVLYERIDSNNVRIVTLWMKWYYAFIRINGSPSILGGVTIYHDGAKQFISNSWYLDEEIESL